MQEHALLTIAAIGIAALASQWLAWWVKLPAILFLLLAGIVAGPVTGLLNPDALLGELLLPVISLSVAVILFEGGLTLKWSEIRGLETVVRRLVTSGVIVTWLVTAFFTHWLLDFSWPLAFLFGAVTVVTGPTVIVPLLRTVRPTSHVASILRWEGIVIDPVGALLSVLVFEFIVSGSGGAALGHTLLTFGRILAVGLLLGVGAAHALGIALRNHWLPEYLHNVAALTIVFAVFSISDTLAHESGLLAVTVMGLWLTNMRDVSVDEILNFKESLSVLLISGLFILLAARLDVAEVRALGWGALGVLAAIQFVARPLKVLVSTVGSSLTAGERGLLAWIAPRGIVAAAVAAVFALRLEEQGYAQASFLVPLTFLVIIGTVVLQSISARPVARLLGVASPEPSGFLIVGANPVARAVAKALEKQDVHCLLADANWQNVRLAAMAGLDTYYGNPVSAHADSNLDLVGFGRLLALDPHTELNALAMLRYRAEFGEKNIYSLPGENGGGVRDRSVSRIPGRIAFGREAVFDRLVEMLAGGAEIRATRLTQRFDFDAYYKLYFGRFIPLFAVAPKGDLHIYSEGSDLNTGEGWTLVSLIQETSETEGAPERPPDAGDGPRDED